MGAIAQALGQFADPQAIPSVQALVDHLRSIKGDRCIKAIMKKWQDKIQLSKTDPNSTGHGVKAILAFHWDIIWDLWSEILCETCIKSEMVKDAKQAIATLEDTLP